MTTALIGSRRSARSSRPSPAVVLRAAGAGGRRGVGGGRRGGGRRRAELAELRLRALRDLVPLVALRLDGAGRLVEANRLARERFPFLVPGMSVLEAFSEHTLAARGRRRPGRPGAAGVRRAPVRGRPAHLPGVGGALRRRRGPRGAPAPARRLARSSTTRSCAPSSSRTCPTSCARRSPGCGRCSRRCRTRRWTPTTRGDFTARAASETQRLEALISDILFLSELEATQGAPSSDRSDLAEAAHAHARGARRARRRAQGDAGRGRAGAGLDAAVRADGA